ncbi:hypothetical protein ACUN22_20885 [Streptomyces anulatus]|uniref:hypothetical protein n=1 Tax=Streptomyces anulatus TaxID=1892 RepID=UPI00403DE2ED
MRCGWHPSKSSRIMNARTPPSAGDIRAADAVTEVAAPRRAAATHPTAPARRRSSVE